MRTAPSAAVDLVPALLALAQRRAQLLQLCLGNPDREHLTALEPDRPAARRGLLAHACTSAGSTNLGEHPARGARMQERDPRGADPGARLLVDHPHPGLAQPGEGGVDVGHLVGDVVQARPALGQELADRRLLAERGEQLHVVLADVEQHGLDALRLDHLAVDELHAVRGRVELDRGVEVADGDADVVDPAEHRAQCTLTPQCASPSRPIRSRGAGSTLSRSRTPCARPARRSRSSAASRRSSSARRRPRRSGSRSPAATARSARRRSWRAVWASRWP